jgi:hypothetical protein
VLLAAGLGCAGPAPAPLTALEPLPSTGAYVPDATDLALRDLGRGLLADDAAAMDDAVGRVAIEDAARATAGDGPTGALPRALDARHAAIRDPGRYRAVSARLLERKDLPPEIRARISQELQDDPLALADARLREARTLRWGRIFNALAEAAGQSLTNTLLLGYRLANALVAVAVAERTSDEISVPERQALRYWKQFVEEHPEAPEAPAVVDRIEEAQRRWYDTQRDHAVFAAEKALDAGDARLGLALSERAVRYANEDRRARHLLADAEARTTAERQRLSESEGAELREGALSPEARKLALALLAAGPGETEAVDAAAEPLLQRKGPEADEARFAVAVMAAESGDRAAFWDTLEDLEGKSARKSAMARHAWAATESPAENPYRYWKRARRAALGDKVRWVLFGPLAHGARERPHMARPVEWLIEIPSIVPMLTGLPQRLVRAPWVKDDRRSPAVFAERYLAREPDGEHAPEVRDWLVGYHEKRGNYAAALAVLEGGPDPPGGDVARLRVKAGDQLLEFAGKEKDLPTRVALLRRVGREYEGTPAAKQAVEELRQTIREATPQHIQISRGFLQENPEVAGPNGLALRPELLDGDKSNGELHPEGVALLGGRQIEICYLDEAGDPRHDPVRRRERVSSERIQRTVARLEEASLHNVLVDPDYPIEYDADRDLFFERARLGLADEAHPSADARSSYAFRGVRERYGLVKKRESILPVELVVQGSLDTMSLGAFPRIRMPKKTPDAFLFE